MLPSGRRAQNVLVMDAGAGAVRQIIAGIAHLDLRQRGYLIGSDMLCCGIGTLLQSVGIGPFGNRTPAIMAVTFAAVGPMIALARGVRSVSRPGATNDAIGAAGGSGHMSRTQTILEANYGITVKSHVDLTLEPDKGLVDISVPNPNIRYALAVGSTVGFGF